MTILIRETHGAIAHLTLNTPEKLNALSVEMLSDLQDSLDSITADDTIKAVVLSGAGKAFCAGHDLKQMTAARQGEDGGQAAFKALFDQCAAIMQTITTMPAAGDRFGPRHRHCGRVSVGGKLRSGSRRAGHALRGQRRQYRPFLLDPDGRALSRNIPRKQAFEMLTTGEFIEADRARGTGPHQPYRRQPTTALPMKRKPLAETLAAKLGSAVRIGKRAFYEQLQMTVDQAYAYTGDVMVENMAHRDTEEGIAAFLEKRAPDWG